MNHIIESLLDTDKYKFSMGQLFLHEFSSTTARYKFKCRTEGVDLLPFLDEINKEVDHLCTLRFRDEELDIFRKETYFKEDYIEFLRLFSLNRNYIKIFEENGELAIETDGPVVYTMPFEIYILEIVQEVYTRNTYPNIDFDRADKILDIKIAKIKDYVNNGGQFKFADFGGRRRQSRKWHEHVVTRLYKELGAGSFVGTSNMRLSHKLGIKSIGTHAHELFMLCQGANKSVRLENSQRYALDLWMKEYEGDLGIALSDTLGSKKFFKDMNKRLSMGFSGLRHDSGPAESFGDDAIIHYKSHGIDPMSKSIIFSDGLNIDRAIEIADYFTGRIGFSFGIGTNLTFDWGGDAIPLQNVMKLIYADGNPVAKLSDEPAKAQSPSEEFLSYLRYVVDRNINF